MTELTILVEKVLGNNEEVSRRLECLEIHPVNREFVIASEPQNASGSEGQDEKSSSATFEQDLYASPVYARTMKGKSNLSLPLSTRHSNARSFLSNLSLADVSDISVLSLPISTAEIWNYHHYMTEQDRMSKKHASPRESSRCALSQGDFVFRANAELERMLDKFPNGDISEDKSSSCVPGKIMLLGALNLYLSESSTTRITSAECTNSAGISLAGKTTVFKQLQNLYAGGFTPADRVEARAAILNSLLSAFQGAWNRVRYIGDDFEDDAERLLNARNLPKKSPEVKMNSP